jgi:hypothetical protein
MQMKRRSLHRRIEIRAVFFCQITPASKAAAKGGDGSTMDGNSTSQSQPPPAPGRVCHPAAIGGDAH